MNSLESMTPVIENEEASEYKTKPEPYEKWRWNPNLKSNDRAGYSEYVITELIKMTDNKAKWLDNDEDGPDTGDVWVPLETGKEYYIDVKYGTGLELGRQWDDKNTVNIHIDPITLRKLESGNIETQRDVLNLIADTAHEYNSGENLELLKHAGM